MKWFNDRYVKRADYDILRDELNDTLKAYENLSLGCRGLQTEIELLERQALELFKLRLEHRYALFGKSEEQFSVMRTSYPNLGDLYVKRYRPELG